MRLRIHADEILSKAEVEKLFKCSRYTISRELAAGRLKGYRLMGRTVFLGRDLLAWVQATPFRTKAKEEVEQGSA